VRLDALHALQARIVEAADTARRRVERDLHDGAQQRLIALSLTLSFARTQLGQGAPGGAAGLGDALDAMSGLGSLGTTLVRASEQVDLALEELRELARGIHPAVLSQGGLAAAIELMAERAPLPVLTAVPRARYRPVIEATVYFVICEALANAVKHAHATKVSVAAGEVEGAGDGGRWLLVEVADDGIGGADPGRGSGIVGLADRVAAIGGRLAIESPAGRGTRVEARLPCA
jgi:signal transduction histidine kinase